MTRLSSAKYRDGAKGATCKFRIAGVCMGGTDTTVFCHIRDRHHGRGVKASDISGGDGCQSCHDVFDRRAKMPNGELISELDWHFYALRALQETLEQRIDAGILPFPHDAPPAIKQSKPRKPKAERAAVKSRPTKWPTTKIPTKPFPKARTK